MEIVAGKARGIQLRSPANNEVRPTSIRARKAFFDSLGNLEGLVFADLCAGSGAMGLEAASRGAGKVYFFEKSKSSSKIIQQNCNLVARTGVDAEFELIPCELPALPGKVRLLEKPDVIFADPPYEISMEILQGLTASPVFTDWAADSVLYWELPDNGKQLEPPCKPWKITEIRTLGSTRFLVLHCIN